jgi:hypothetical protein
MDSFFAVGFLIWSIASSPYDVSQMYGSCPISGEDDFNDSNKSSDTLHINSTIWSSLYYMYSIFGKGKICFDD